MYPTCKTCQTNKLTAFTIHLKDHLLIMVKNQQFILSICTQLEDCVLNTLECKCNNYLSITEADFKTRPQQLL